MFAGVGFAEEPAARGGRSRLSGDGVDDGQTKTSKRKLIIKYRSQGENALVECADALTSRGDAFADHTADGSPSLDRLHRRFGLGRHRALFRRPEARDFAAERERMGRRYRRLIRNRTPQQRRAHAPEPPDLSHIYRVAVPRDVVVEDLLDALRADPHVEYAQADHVITLDQAETPFTDPFLSSSGSWGQPYGDLWGLEQIDAPRVWSSTQGDGVVVAVVDTGLDRFHPDIADNVWVNPGEDLNGDGRATPEDANGIDDDGNGFIDDLTGFNFADSIDVDEDGFYDGPDDVSNPDPFDTVGHGTHVSGTIAAVAGNGIGIAGVAPRARIMALRGFPTTGPAADSDLWRAVLYAAENGAHVVNNSWSCREACPQNPLAEDVLALVDALDTVVVTSAGNASQDVLFRSPENGSRVLTVGAVGFDEIPADFSNRGWGLDVMAPGGGPNEAPGVRAARRNILSLLTSAIDADDEAFSVGTHYWRLAGTSMSAPHVTGAVALLRSLRPDLTPAQVRRAVRMSGRDAGLPGHDPTFGAGLLDVPALLSTPVPAISLSIDSPAPGSIHDPRSGPITITGRASGADLESVEVSFASGIAGRDFELIEDLDPGPDRVFGSSDAPNVLKHWDAGEIADGPYVVRVRARLRDGRSVDEFLVLSVERNAPVRISGRDLGVGLPDVSGRRVLWPVAESAEIGAPFDLELGRLRRPKRPWRPDSTNSDSSAEPRTRLLVETEGSQDDVALGGQVLAWRTRDAEGTKLEWCRLEAKTGCDPKLIAQSEGAIGAPFVANGWIVWAGTDAIEGCQVSRADPICRPGRIVDDDSGTIWTPRSLDGESLLLSGPGGIHALCTLDSSSGHCRPDPIAFSPTTPVPFEAVHDGRLLAFSEVGIDRRPPALCLPGEFIPTCPSSIAVVVRYHACWLDADSNSCDPVPITSMERVENFAGLAVSGRRVFWSVASATEEAAVRFCEFEPSTRRCVPQRITGSAARQDGLAVDGNRLVWRDRRPGPRSIWGTELITLAGPPRVHKRAGWNFSIPFRVKPVASKALSYSVSAVTGIAPALAKARMEDRGKPGGVVQLRGHMPKGSEGVHQWRVRAEGEGGHFSEWVVELEVTPAPNVSGRTKDWTRSGR